MAYEELKAIGNEIIENCNGGEDTPEAYTDPEAVMWFCHRFDDDKGVSVPDITEEDAEIIASYIKDQIER